MSYGRIELPLGAAFAGIGFAIMLPALGEMQKHGSGGGAIAIASVLGLLGTAIGMAPAWDEGISLWRNGGWYFFGAWILVGIIFGSAVALGAFLSNSHWWGMGLGILALLQLVVIAGPLFLRFWRTRDKDCKGM